MSNFCAVDQRQIHHDVYSLCLTSSEYFVGGLNRAIAIWDLSMPGKCKYVLFF